MPKITKRRTSQLQHVPPATRQTAIMTPRKISFEDSLSSSSQLHSLHSCSSGSLTRTSCCRNLKPKLLKRPTPSTCLAQMAAPDLLESSSSSSFSDSFTTSPISVMSSRDESCSSPWGQFVDVIPANPEEDETSSCGSSTHSCNYFRSSLGSPKSYVHQPYFKPKRIPIRKKNSFLPGFILSIPSVPSSEEALEGALERMRV